MAEITDSRVILSLGDGVQSTALALMAVQGELPGFRRPVAAIFADTGWEPRGVYDHLHWLIQELGEALPVHIVADRHPDGTPSNIYTDTLALVAYRRERAPGLPVYVKETHQQNPSLLKTRRHGTPFIEIPVWARDDFTGKIGQMRRQCTGSYKIAPIYRCTRQLIARPPRIRKTRPPFVEMWVGISAEERDKRCKPSREPWITNRWPLRELGLSRLDCERWLLERYGRVVFKSACVACPFHDDAYWLSMREHRPDEWEQACDFDEQIRFLPGIRGQCFVHRSCVPLREIDFNLTSRERRLEARGQMGLFDPSDMCHL